MLSFRQLVLCCLTMGITVLCCGEEARVNDWVLRDDHDFVANPGDVKELKAYFIHKLAQGADAEERSLPLLAAPLGEEQYLRVTELAPHAVRWELKIEMSWQGGFERTWQFAEKGFYVAKGGDQRKEGEDRVTTDDPPYTIVVERDGEELRYFVNNVLKSTLKVAADDRTPLQAGSERFGYHILSSRLSFKKGEELSDPPKVKASDVAIEKIQWEGAHRNDFSTAKSVDSYLKYLGGELVWNEKYQAMLIKNTEAGGEIYAAVHQSLPGDLRVRFRALRRKDADQVSIGIMFSIDGSLKKMDGYFAEWAEGTARLKKAGHLEKKAEAPTPATDDRWVSLELCRVGGRIFMKTEGKTVLEWDDPHPFTTRGHDLLSFYVWSEQTIIDDLVIERNAEDLVKPLKDDPATEDNIIRSKRPGLEGPQGDF